MKKTDAIQQGRTIWDMVLFALAACLVLFCSGCKEPKPVTLFLHCSPVFWELMREETAAYHQIYGNRIVMLPIQIQQDPTPPPTTGRSPAPWRSRPKMPLPATQAEVMLEPSISHLISSLSTEGRKDMFLTDSELQVKAIEDASSVSYRYPCCYLSLALFVPRGNPLKIESVGGMLENNRRLGMMNPAIDGAGWAALGVISKVAPDVPKEIRETLVRQFDRLEALLKALEDGEIDAALIWSSTNLKSWLVKEYGMAFAGRFENRIDDAKNRNDVEALNAVLDEMAQAIVTEKAFAETVPLSEEQSAFEISLISLSSSLNDGHNRRFADFLISTQGKKIMQKHGFVPK